MRGFFSSPSCSVSTCSRAALAMSTTYQPFLLVMSKRLPSRAKGPTEKLSGSSFDGFPSLAVSPAASFAASVPGLSPSFFGGGVRLRGCFSSMR